MMEFFRQRASRPFGYALGGMALLSALILSFGPAVSFDGYAPLASIGNQIVACLLAPAGYAAYFLVQLRIQHTVQERMNAALGQGEADEAARRGAEERAAGQQDVRLIAERFRTALSRLKQRRFGQGGQRLHELPWYVIIGPPGSGKTTAIVNSGLSFPLADQIGKASVAGIGGTRNCDWWFTDQAVLIDTAGRYVTQDSAAERDRTAWLGFLRLLRRYRRRLPLNGVIVAMAADELAQASEVQRQEHALRIRQRVQELHRELRLRLPVYLVITKLDLIAGFVEFFDDLGQEGRRAVWGMTFPLTEQEPEGGSVTAFATGFEALVGRLHDRLIERVQREGDLERRARIFGFPQQVASVKDAALSFLQHVFAPNSFEEPPLLRGVYFASGTQLGTPLDRVTEAMARSFAVARPKAAAFSGKQRSYFLHDLLHSVIFPESGLAERQPRALRRRARQRLALGLGLLLVVLMGGGAWGFGYARNLRLIEDVRRTAETASAEAEGLALERVEDDALAPILPLLDRLRALAERLRQRPAHPTEAGLDQSEKLAAQAEQAYRRALNGAFLPRLLLRLENLAAQRQEDPIQLYQTFKVYLMLGQQGPLQREAVRRWMRRDWQSTFPGEAEAPRRAALLAHLETLLAEPLGAIGLNGPLVEQVRGALQRISHPQLVLNAITGSAEAARLPAWRLADMAGPAAPDVLRRRSGQPLTAGIPGIFTSAGFHGVFLRLLPAAAAAQAEDLWLLAPPGAPAPTEAPREAARRLEREATELYLQAFSLQWDGLIGDVTVAPMETVSDALRVLNVLSAPSSPIRLILFAAVRDTALDRPPGEGEAPAPPPPESPAGQAARHVAERFQPLRRLVEVPANSQAGAQAPIDDVLRDLEQLYRSLSELQGAASDPVRQGGQAAAAVAQIERRAALLPAPIAQWVLGVGRTSSDLSLSSARQQLGEAWRNGPGPLCQRATTNRFPFVPRAQAETPLGDFGRLFGPGGALDAFFTEHLQGLVDTSRSPWTARAGGPDAFRLPAEVIAQFERAAAIRAALFQDGGSRPAVGFSLALSELGPATTAAQIELDGRALRLAPGEREAHRLRWPGAEGAGAASLSFDGGEGLGAAFATRGAWSLFRLLAAGELRPLGRDSMQLRLAAGPNQASVILTPDNLQNPFDPVLFTRFRCPAIR